MTLTAALEKNTELKQEVILLKQQVAWFKQQMFGSGKSEKLDKNQIPLGLEETALAEIEEQATTVSYDRKKHKPQLSKEETYDHIPVGKTIIIDPKEVEQDPKAYELIGEEKTFELAITTPKLYRIEYIYRKYRFKADRNQAPLKAPAILRPVQGIASTSLLVYIMLGKYLDHLPLYRQEKILKRHGAVIHRQNMVNWVTQVAEWLKPIYNHMREDLIRGNYLQIDETPIKVLDPDSHQKKIRQGWLWPISRPNDDVIFSWSITRGSSHLEDLLKGFRGYLQSDAYSAYGKYISEHEGITPVGCMAHSRRKFKEADKEGEAPLAILKIMASLYAIEKALRDSDASFDEVYALRQKEVLPILDKLHEKLLTVRQEALPQSLTGKACDYALGQWSNLRTYIDDGQLQIDNNLIENAIRPSAIGKKNWMFIGHPSAGERSAIIYSIVVSCERHGINPSDYLTDVLQKVPYLVNRDQSHLTPKNWKINQQKEAA